MFNQDVGSVLSRAGAELALSNDNHDEHGRFASSDSAGAATRSASENTLANAHPESPIGAPAQAAMEAAKRGDHTAAAVAHDAAAAKHLEMATMYRRVKESHGRGRDPAEEHHDKLASLHRRAAAVHRAVDGGTKDEAPRIVGDAADRLPVDQSSHASVAEKRDAHQRAAYAWTGQGNDVERNRHSDAAVKYAILATKLKGK